MSYAQYMGFPVGTSVKNPPANAGDIRDMGSIPGSGRSPGEGNGNPLQYSCPENPMDRGAWRATVHGVAKRRGHDQSDLAHTHSLLSYICSCIVCNILVKQSFQAICCMES